MRVFDFPNVPVSKQLFHVPGAAQEGGFTSGAVRIISPEPGGRSVLELQISMQVREWEFPFASWIMSKGNGEVFRVRLTKTPQLITSRSIRRPAFDAYPRDEDYWHAPETNDDLTAPFVTGALEGSQRITIDMALIGDVLYPGHVIGHGDQTYIVDDISYDAQLRATIEVKPPFRKTISAGETCKFTPTFLGTIGNIGEVRNTYDAESVGHIQPGKIIFAEAIL